MLECQWILVRDVSSSFAVGALRSDDSATIQQATAEQQHEKYVVQLESECKRVLRLRGLSTLPDCCFVEDCAIAAQDM
ncbi:MAG: hypothetical protein MHM6MM_000471 [Cercozoa sp. M6MM]